jgi:hypothetical protein
MSGIELRKARQQEIIEKLLLAMNELVKRQRGGFGNNASVDPENAAVKRIVKSTLGALEVEKEVPLSYDGKPGETIVDQILVPILGEKGFFNRMGRTGTVIIEDERAVGSEGEALTKRFSVNFQSKGLLSHESFFFEGKRPNLLIGYLHKELGL